MDQSQIAGRDRTANRDHAQRGGTLLQNDKQDSPVHLRSKVLEIAMTVVGGSPTEVDISIPNCGGFLAAYGDIGPEKLRSLQNAIGGTVNTWFERNPTQFGVGTSTQ